MTTYQAATVSIDVLESRVYALVECGKFGDALDIIRQFVESVIFDHRSVGKVFASAKLDKLCHFVGEVAAKKLSVDSYPKKRKGTVILCTELIKAGGHLELIKDYIRLSLFDEPINVLLTDCFARSDYDMITNFSLTYGISIDVANGSTSDDRLSWVVKRLFDLAPTRLVLLTHHQDSVGIAAACSHAAEKVIFIHHADHHLSLGVTCEDFIHVDPHNIGFFHCMDDLGVKNNYYWPLTVNCDSLEPRSKSFITDGNLVTCSSGRSEKFDAIYYLYDYCNVIIKIMIATSCRHFHIGCLTADMEARLQHDFMVQGIDPKRFINIPWVPSIAKALIEYNVDLYISSFPIGGGKATIEAMAAGVPLLMHQSYRSRFHGGVDLAYPDAWIWQTDADLVAIIYNMKEDDLRRHSLLARLHYEKFHTDQVLKNSVDFSKSQNIAVVPQIREYVNDALQMFLDETAEINAMQNNNLSEIKRVNNEWLIATNEIGRVKSELLIAANEIGRVESELLIATNEIGRVKSELLIATNEIGRVKSELLIATNEIGRVKSELLIATNEIGRVKSELLIATNEIGRVKSELLIATNEIGRVKSELLNLIEDRDALNSENAELRKRLNSPKILARSLVKLLISGMLR